MAAPAIAAKEVQAIQLYARRKGWQRLDQGPFFLAYGALALLVVYQALTQEWCAPGLGRWSSRCLIGPFGRALTELPRPAGAPCPWHRT